MSLSSVEPCRFAEASGTLEHPQSVFDPLVWNEQLHTGCSAFHGGIDTDDGRGHASGIQGDPRDLGINACRIGLDDLHDEWPTHRKGPLIVRAARPDSEKDPSEALSLRRSAQRSTRSSHDPVHGDVMRLWKDRVDQRVGIAKPDPQMPAAHARERAIEEAAPVTEAIAGRIEADDRSKDHGWNDLRSIRGIWNVP